MCLAAVDVDLKHRSIWHEKRKMVRGNLVHQHKACTVAGCIFLRGELRPMCYKTLILMLTAIAALSPSSCSTKL